MNTISRRTIPVLGLLFAAVAGVSVQAQTLDYRNYNAIIFNNLNTTSGIEGRTFVGNDFTGTRSADFGTRLKNTVTPTDRSFVVGNNLVSGNPLNVQRGSLYIDGSTNDRRINFNAGGSVVADHSIDAALNQIRGYSIAESQALSSMLADSMVTLPSGSPGPTTFNATAGADGVAVFNVTAASIFNNPFGQQFNLNTDANTDNIIINVSGTSVNWTNGNMVSNFTSNYWQEHTLWNFYEATTINLNDHGFNGGILAPYASITTSAEINGLVVANNLTTAAEVRLPDSSSANAYAYDGFAAPIPEPGSAVFILAAGGLFLIVRNRRLVTGTY
jgi:choice-of-anchor A domain-containing protein